MNNMDKIVKVLDEKLKFSLEVLKVKDILGNVDLNDGTDNQEYLELSVMHFLSLIKLNRLYKNKKIDIDLYDSLKNNLDQYYRIKGKIAELDYVSYISDNINIDTFLANYTELLSSLFKSLSYYDVLFDPVEDEMSSIIINGIDKKIKNKKKNNIKKRNGI